MYFIVESASKVKYNFVMDLSQPPVLVDLTKDVLLNKDVLLSDVKLP